MFIFCNQTDPDCIWSVGMNSYTHPLCNRTICRQTLTWCYVKPWLRIQNLCSSCSERLCFIWCSVHYCQHIWKVLSLETSPILFRGRTEYFTAGGRKWDLPSRDCLRCILDGAAIGRSHTVQNTLEQTIIYLSPHFWGFFFMLYLCVCRKERKGRKKNC